MRCGERCLQELVDNGDIPALELNQKHTVLLREDVIDYVRTRGREQAAERKARAKRTNPPPSAEPKPHRTRSGPRRAAPPDLKAYEITTGVQPG
ncbi:hypothetical protein Y882_02805 [Dyella japonica DSM 16301]|uniref:Helix-turn-helix domain-containing protein n=2 Tax=Dyella japonica TaxID=231455 RepID=A0A0G9H777_9GAMM|nr:hypothetical protein Y882_02805 [Dyella japonica DSM 16301]